MEVIIDQFKISDDDLIVDLSNLPNFCILVDKENREWRYILKKCTLNVLGYTLVSLTELQSIYCKTLPNYINLDIYDIYKTGEIKLTIKV